jgi:2'-5' RNA ligase
MNTRCRDQAASTRAFTVTFASTQRVYDPFERSHKLFLICGTGADTLTKLHNGFYTGPLLKEMVPDHPFRPHMTVATQPTGDEIDHLDPGLLGPLPIAAQIEALALVKLTRGTLHPVETVSLLP